MSTLASKSFSILKVLKEFTDEDHPLNATEILSKLSIMGIETERRSVYRCIIALDEAGYDIVKVGKNGWFFGNRLLETAEVKILMDAVQQAHFLTPKKSIELLDKLLSLTSKSIADELKKQISISSRPKHKNESIYYNVDKINTAIVKNKQLSFKYFSYDTKGNRVLSKNGYTYRVSPYFTSWYYENYYMISTTKEYTNFSHYRIEKMTDRMLDMGFIDQVFKIVKTIPRDRTTMMFSATMPSAIKQLSKSYMKQPVIIELESDTKTVDSTVQVYYRVQHNEKRTQLDRVLKVEQPDSCLIFCNTRAEVDRVSRYLSNKRYFVGSLHGANSQVSRMKTLDKIQKGTIQVVVATDVAARGLHIEDLGLVINYDVPIEKDSYVHRIGRTGRAGKMGKAISLVTTEDIMALYDIEEHVGALIEEGELPTEDEVKKCIAEPTGKWANKKAPVTSSHLPNKRSHSTKQSYEHHPHRTKHEGHKSVAKKKPYTDNRNKPVVKKQSKPTYNSPVKTNKAVVQNNRKSLRNRDFNKNSTIYKAKAEEARLKRLETAKKNNSFLKKLSKIVKKK